MLYQLSYPAVGGRIIENCPGFVKIPLTVLCHGGVAMSIHNLYRVESLAPRR